MIEAPAGTAWYVYGVGEDDPALSRLAGVELIRRGGLTAVVREVPLAEFDEAVLPERLNDREWLERNARAHEDVLQAAAAVTAVVPLRFGTIYRSREHVERMLDERAEEFGATLDQVRGHVEVGVKAWIDLRTLERTLAGGDEPTAGGEGAAYLQRRQREQQRSREVAVRCAELAEEAHSRLSSQAVAAVANRPQPRELTGRSESMLLNGAYLIREGDDRLRRELEHLAAVHAAAGVEYELTGPWPPHNFAGEQR
ncbi:MAG TPA: GvpL/GvpF family gas vesicle protein [Gaiellaceae bacterium]|nr:GvpL/GvpF family gas vesicle protein [Gaiellaceae bacterium]